MQRITQTESIPDRNHAYLSNGVIGLLVPEIPAFADHAFVSGYVQRSPEQAHEEIAPAPYPLGFDIGINGWWLGEYPSLGRFVEQSLDMATGELTSRFRVEAPAATAEVEMLTFVCRSQPQIALQRTTLRVDKPCRLVVRAKVDLRGQPGRLVDRIMTGRHGAPRSHEVHEVGDRDAIVLWESEGGLGRLGLAYDSTLQAEASVHRIRNDYGHERDQALTNYTLDAEPGQAIVLEQTAAMVPVVRHPEPHYQAYRMVAHARFHGFDRLREQNRDAWSELWAGRPIFDGAEPKYQQLSDACYFYTHSSIHPGSYTGIAPFGLSHRNYLGHVFWDYESFMLPGVALTAPGAARASMDYRGRCLEMARHNAALHGLPGVQFPMQSGNTGAEVTPYYCSAREFHITPAVGFAVGQYLDATGDQLFLREYGWPILRGVAEWCQSFVTKTARGYETHHLASPNERYYDVNNDAQMHLFMIGALRAATHYGKHLGQPVPRQWQEIAENLFFPTDPETATVVQFEDFPLATESRASVGPMWALFPVDHSYGPQTDKATQRFFQRTMHSYYGSPMQSSYCAVWQARMGARDEALTALDRGMLSRFHEPFNQFVEAAPDIGDGMWPNNRTEPWLTKRTCFVTACGGFLTSALLGFSGLQLRHGARVQDWPTYDAALPGNWRAMEVQKLWAHGEPYRLVARSGGKATLTPVT